MADGGPSGYHRPLSTALDDVNFLTDHSLADSDYLLHHQQQQQQLHSLQQQQQSSSFVDNYHNMPQSLSHHVQQQIQQQKMNIPHSSSATSVPPSNSSNQANDLRSKFLPSNPSSQVPSASSAPRKITGNNSSISSWTPSSSSTSATHHGHTSSLCATGHGVSNHGPSISNYSSSAGHHSTGQPQNNSRNHNLKAMAEIQKSLLGAASRGPGCMIPQSFTVEGLKREIAKVTNERDAILQEYQLVMSERDLVHTEIDRLNDAVNEMTARLRSSSEEMNRLKREVATCQAEKDRYKQELQELKDRYGADLAMSYLLGDDRSQSLTSDGSLFHVPGMRTSISRAINNSSAINNNNAGGISKGSSGDLLRHHYLSTSSSNSSVVGVGLQQKNQLSGHNQSSYACDNLDMANYEIDQLRRQNAQLQDKVAEAQQEAEVSKKRRDWAVSEKKKMILERESIRYLCDSLRKERNTRDRELSKALTDNDELKKQVKELSRQISELKDKLEESNRLEKENVTNCSRDSAIDTDDNLAGAAGLAVDNIVRSTENVINSQEAAPAQSNRLGGHPGLTSSESELLELSMKHHSINDASHRPESRLTDPRFTTVDPIVHSDVEHRPDHRTEDRRQYDHRIQPRFASLASEPASRPPSVAGDPFDPWTGPLPESYITAHSGHLTPANVHVSTSGHLTPAGILTPGHNPRSSNSGHNSDQYLDVKPYLGEVRDIVVAKSSEPLGISILVDNKKTGSIFVSSVNENSLAAQAGLQVGDQLLDVNGLNLRSGVVSMSSKIATKTAKTMLTRSTTSGDELKMRVQYNPEKFELLSKNIEQDVLIPDSLVGNLDVAHHDF